VSLLGGLSRPAKRRPGSKTCVRSKTFSAIAAGSDPGPTASAASAPRATATDRAAARNQIISG